MTLRTPSAPARIAIPVAAIAMTVAVLVLFAAPAPAAPAATAAGAGKPVTVDARMRAAILDELARHVRDAYVEADTARLIVDELRRRQRAGAYDAITNPAQFAEAVTADLRRVNGDLHLSLRYDPGRGARGAAGSGPVMRRVIGSPPAGAGGPMADSALRRMPGMGNPHEKNFGLTKLEILPGNVGYLEISGFLGAPGAEDAVAAAMRFLERTDAIVLDVRQNGGGSGMMSHFVFSHFLGPEPVPTIAVTSRESAEPETLRSLADVSGPRRPDVPLWVLTSRRTGSAAEEFSFVLKNLGRATIVGDRTAGAGHMVQAFDLAHDFVAGVSITRVADARTGLEWEAVGVQPDVAVDSDRALAAAHVAALRKLAANAADAGRRKRLDWTAEWIEARDRSAGPDPAGAARLTGGYEADRSVSVRDGRLWYRRAGAPATELVPLGGDVFALDGETRFRFEAGSPARGFTIERADGTTTRVARTDAS